MLAWALWRSCCWPGRCGGAVAGRGAVEESHRESAACRNAVAESHRESTAGLGAVAELLPAGGAVAELHREANKRAQKEKGPEETLISLPSHFYLLPCERATRHATRPNRHSPLACSAGMHCRRSCRRHSPLAFTAGMQCWRSCRCNYAGIARKVAANARIAYSSGNTARIRVLPNTSCPFDISFTPLATSCD